MLDSETRRRIDAARDILVGKVPDPKSQVEQITIALIYKFMWDIDAESEMLGGRRSFFTGEFGRYAWPQLVRAGLGGHETLNLYAEAITRIPQNPGVPQLFRNIFDNAYLPYRDPETLRAFLKVIDQFEYDHSERLGDAFEYLLSVMGAQGDAGQFRTPRHVIDFIVAVLDPKKDETILDPACGTAGFLISAYKHILAANAQRPDPSSRSNPQSAAASAQSTLAPDERARLADNVVGYDISPDMVRLSLVNMYLHGFRSPRIHEYDTLTSEERWNEYADVILANPPFMSPKGGIRTHNRFSVQSRRSEVLFVDYMAEHLTPGGRAGIIVPEGVIFQSQKAHTRLRQKLVRDYLVAVISLPAGVFKPYSGVKTSILILDRALARPASSIAFFKVDHDGFDLGDQRRPIDRNDLPAVARAVKEYLNMDGQDVQDREKEPDPPVPSTLDQLIEQGAALVVDKARIAADGDYNLTGERYRIDHVVRSSWPSVRVGDVFQRVGETVVPKSLRGPVTYVGLQDIAQNSGQLLDNELVHDPSEIKSLKNFFYPGDVLYGKLRPNLNKVWLADRKGICSTDIFVIRPVESKVMSSLYAYLFRGRHFNDAVLSQIKGAQLPRIGWRSFANLEIPLPLLDVQQEIAAEIERYQKVIDGARAVIDNYRPHIPTNPDWPLAPLGDSSIFRVVSGGTPKSTVEDYWNGGVPWATLVDLPPANVITEIRSTRRTISERGLRESSARLVPANSVIVSTRATIGRIAINRIPIATNQGFKNVIIEDPARAVPEYIALALTELVTTMDAWASGGTFKELSKSRFCQLQIPLPPLDIQQSIAAELKAERSLVNANRELTYRFERKIQTAIACVWAGDVLR